MHGFFLEACLDTVAHTLRLLFSAGLLDAGELTSVSTSANAYDSSNCGTSGCVASETRDGSYADSSRWSCSSDLMDGDEECMITYRFDEPQDIEEMKIAFTYGDTRTRSLKVWLNGDLEGTITSSGDTDGLETFSLNSDETETLSLESTGLDSDEWISLTEVSKWRPGVRRRVTSIQML